VDAARYPAIGVMSSPLRRVTPSEHAAALPSQASDLALMISRNGANHATSLDGRALRL